jgi:periplasmic protein TonB
MPLRFDLSAQRPAMIAAAVIALHVGGLVALQNGLLVRAYEVIVPVEMLSQMIEPPKPETAPPPPASPAPPAPALRTKQEAPPPAPQPLAINNPTPAPTAPVVAPAPTALLPPIAAPVAAPVAATPTPAPVAPPTPALLPAAPAAVAAKVELPRSDADYLDNPPPPYPPVSRRLREHGRVMVRVCVDEKGVPQKAELYKSSGFERLDATAVATTMRWRYKPGTRGGVPEALCAFIPMDFTLDN